MVGKAFNNDLLIAMFSVVTVGKEEMQVFFMIDSCLLEKS